MEFINEKGFLSALSFIKDKGDDVYNERTKKKTFLKHAIQLRFDLSSFPLITTRFVSFDIVAKELFWFLSGSTDVGELKKQGVKIWDANSNREFLDNYGFTSRKEDDIGPSYGFQWRYSGAEYVDHKTDYRGKGIDQIINIIDDLKNNKTSRRIILNSWNVSDINNCNLPPCHCFAQFTVIENKLLCSVTQRSGDMALGVPYNIASYALLTYLLAKITDLIPGELVLTINNAHIYEDHVEGVIEQLTRTVKNPPTLVIKEIKNNITDYKPRDCLLEGYEHYAPINFPMAV